MANPAFTHGQREPLYQDLIDRAWTAPTQGAFMGGWQPFAPRKFPPSLLSVDSPPAYLPELVILDAEDPTIYFRAQRWPWQKIIVSVDNPPFMHPGRSVAIQAIIRAWEPPLPFPREPRYPLLPANITGAFSSTGTGTDSWVGSFVAPVPKTPLQTHIIRAWDVPATVQQRRTLFPQVAATSASGTFGSAGLGTDIWTGSALDSGAASSIGTGTDTWVGALSQNSAPKVVTQAQIVLAWAPQYLIQQPRRLLPQINTASTNGSFLSAGLGLATWVGADVAKASFLASGQGVAAFVGTTKTAKATRFDGWKPRQERLVLQRRKEEDEIMAILAAVLPLVESGKVRASTRISVSRNGRMTIQ